jgi:hypothetical protein
MRTVLTALIILATLVLTSCVAEAANWSPTCTTFVYVNGVKTPQKNDVTILVQRDWLPQFKSYLSAKGKLNLLCYNANTDPATQATGITYVYNPSNGFPADLYLAAEKLGVQKAMIDTFVNQQMIIDSNTPRDILVSYALASSTTPSSNLIGIMNDSTKLAVTTRNSLSIADQNVLDSLVGLLVSEIKQNHTAVCIGHSEGNLFCNLAYRTIAESGLLNNLGITLPNQTALEVIGIATPTSYMADGRNSYITVCNDIVALVPNSLSPNFGQSGCGSSWWNAFWQLQVSYWLNSFGSILSSGTASFNAHLISTYLAVGSDTQERVMEIMEQAMTPSSYVLGPTNCQWAWVTSTYYSGGQHDGDLRTGGWGDTYYSLLKCDIPLNPTVASKAVLLLYAYPLQGSRSRIYLDRVTSAWDNTTKWTNKPTSVRVATLSAPVDNAWYEIDVTDLYNNWQKCTYPNYGVMLSATSNSNVFNTFRSPEYVNPVYHPELVITSATSAITPTYSPPTITLKGSNPVSVSQGTSYTDAGATATSNKDGDITAKVVVSGSVNTSVAGTYTLTYNVTDSAGLSAAPVTRTVNVVSSSGNTTTYTLSSSQCNVVWTNSYNYYGGGQHDADMIVGGWGDTYYSLFKCSLTGMPSSATSVKLRFYEYPSSHGGGRSQIYFDRVTSAWDNTTKWQTMPTSVNLSLFPAPTDNQWYEIDITALYNGWQNGTYTNYGVMLRPYSNGNIFDVFRSTEYSDANYRPQLVITATAGSNTPPVITLSGANPLSLTVGQSFVEPGYTALDAEEGNITSRVVVSGSVNTSTAGTYTLYYNVSDSKGLAATQVTRTVIVTAQVSTLTGSCAVNGLLTPVTLQAGNTAYFGAGVSGGTSPYHYLWTGATGGDTSSASQYYGYSGTYNTSVAITDSSSPQQHFTANCPQVTVTASSLSVSCVISPTTVALGGSATFAVGVSGGYSPYTYSMPGTNIVPSSSTASSTVTPTTVGTVSYSVTVYDSHGQSLSRSCSLTVTTTALASICSISPSTVRSGQNATYAVAVSGGYPPYTYNLPGTNLIVLTGGAGTTITPTGTGTQTYSGFVTDSQGQVVHPSCSVTVTQ